MKISIADKTANALLDMQPTLPNAARLAAVESIIRGAPAVKPLSFAHIKRVAVSNYLDRVIELKAAMLDRSQHRHIGAARFDLQNLYWKINKAVSGG